MIFKDLFIDLFLYKILCCDLKPNFNIFDVVRRNLGSDLQIDWLIL